MCIQSPKFRKKVYFLYSNVLHRLIIHFHILQDMGQSTYTLTFTLSHFNYPSFSSMLTIVIYTYSKREVSVNFHGHYVQRISLFIVSILTCQSIQINPSWAEQNIRFTSAFFVSKENACPFFHSWNVCWLEHVGLGALKAFTVFRCAVFSNLIYRL